MPSITIHDVADYAGVSRATVSRVLNNNPAVDQALRLRVEDAIQALGYQPNRTARRLRAQSSNVIGLIISDIRNPYFLSIIQGVEDVAYAHQMSLILCNSDEDPTKEQMYLRVMEAEHVAGLIMVPSQSSEEQQLSRLKKIGIPVILLDRVADDFEVDAVKVDNERGAADAVRHLIALGYRRIATITGPVHLTTGRERYTGYRSALEANGLAYDEALVKIGNFKTESGYQLTRELLAMAEPPDAIFVSNNMMTLGALRALREQEIRVPQEMALVGFDDMPWSGDLYSPLTVVSQPTYELGQEATNLLLRRLADPGLPFRTVILQTRLIVRESCGAKLRS
ncbi:MAG: LacI family DNA-binding transcriptional regulator [Chloroflexi bacterium]|nr:LacI family DNA-binding transcriptional regulator [Chloroflexota bacterium]